MDCTVTPNKVSCICTVQLQRPTGFTTLNLTDTCEKGDFLAFGNCYLQKNIENNLKELEHIG